MIYDLDELDIEIVGEIHFGTDFSYKHNGKMYYYKKAKNLEKIYNEIIAEKLAKKLNIPCCHYIMSFHNNDVGISSEMFDKENYVSMEDFLESVYGKRKIDSSNNLEAIWFALESRFDEETVKRVMDDIVKMFMFDILIGNIDRHTKNYGLIIKDGRVELSKIFDNEEMLSDDSIYDGDYSILVGPEDYISIENFYQDPVNIFHKFFNVSASDYKDRFLQMLPVISEESLEDIFKEMESEGIKIIPEIKQKILDKFSINRNLINKYFSSKAK